MEPPPVAAHARERPWPATPWPPSLDLIASARPDARSTVAVGGLAAAAVGLLGVDAGLVWVVAGVWGVRSMAGSRLGFAWGVACLGAGMRWGTLGLGDLEVATRLVGPTIATGTPVVRIGMAVALAAAVVGEAHVGGFRSRAWGERAASALAVSALVPLFVAPGAVEPVWRTIAFRAPAAAGLTAAVLGLTHVIQRIPAAAPAAVAIGGIAVALVAS